MSFVLFQTRVLCQRHIIAPMKIDHCVHVQWMSSQGHHGNGFQSATCIFKHSACIYYSVTPSAINIQLHNPLLSLHSPILIIYLWISIFSSLVTQTSAALILSSSNVISFCWYSFFPCGQKFTGRTLPVLLIIIPPSSVRKVLRTINIGTVCRESIQVFPLNQSARTAQRCPGDFILLCLSLHRKWWATAEAIVTRRPWFQAQTRQRLTMGLGGRDPYVNTGDDYTTWAHTAALVRTAFNKATSHCLWELAPGQMCKSITLSANLTVLARKPVLHRFVHLQKYPTYHKSRHAITIY